MEEAALPGNFGLDTHILKYPPQNFGISNFNTDYAKYLLTLISTIPARYKDIADSMEGNFTPLSARKMKEKVFNYSQYWVYFEQTGIVEIDKTYRSKQYSPDNPKCKGYRFKAKYDRSEVIYSNYSQAFKRKLKADGVEKYKKWKKEYGHLLVWLWSKNELKIETPTAHLYVEVRRQAVNKL